MRYSLNHFMHFSMEVLTEEIWEGILNCLDFVDLVTLRKVSKLSQEISNRLIRRKYEYYEKCLKEIPKKYWISILEHQNHLEICLDNFDEMKIHSEIWISMYKSWIGWNTLMDKVPKQTWFEIPISHNVDCVDVAGSMIAIGNHHDGCYFYDMIQPSQSPFYEIPGPVHEVSFWKKGNDIRAITCFKTRNHTFLEQWDVISKKQLMREIENSPFTLISKSLDYLYTLIRNETAGYREGNEVSYILKIKRLGSDGIETRTIQLPQFDGYIHAVMADGDRMLMYLINELKGVMNIYASSLKYDFMEISSMPWNISEKNVFLVGKSGVFCFLNPELSKISFSVDGTNWKLYDFQRDLKINSKLKIILHHVGLLTLAFESGEVRIYHVENRLEFMNFETIRYITLKFPSPVSHLNITEYNSKQHIILVFEQRFCVVEFNENSEISQS